jgi:hypothetical protein
MPTRHIALVPESGMSLSDLARVSAALQKQITRDVAPTWRVSATIDPFPSLEDVPAGYWPVIITFRPIGSDAGIHIDKNGQPYALIEMSPSWSLTASHVSIEMITDPFGSRSFPGISPRDDQGDVEFRGGVCDPCEHPDSGYLINDVLVSDFCTPAFWEPSSKEQRSFTGAIQAALQVLPGGHLCWYAPTTNTWWLRRLSDGVLTDIEVGVADPARGTVREFICQHSLHLQSTKMTLEAFDARVGPARQRALRASQSRAYWLRASIDQPRGTRSLELEAEVRAELQAARAARQTLEQHRDLEQPVLPPPLPRVDVPGPASSFASAAAAPREERQTFPYGSMGNGLTGNGSMGNGSMGTTTSSIRPTSISSMPRPNGATPSRPNWPALVGVAALAATLASVLVLRRGDVLTAAASLGGRSSLAGAASALPPPAPVPLPTAVTGPVTAAGTPSLNTSVDPAGSPSTPRTVGANQNTLASATMSPTRAAVAVDGNPKARITATHGPLRTAATVADAGAPSPAATAEAMAGPAASATEALPSLRAQGLDVRAGASADEFGGRE